MTIRSTKSEEITAAASKRDAARKGGAALQAHKNAIMCKRPNAKRLSKVEKKRMAALIGWEKRRQQQQKGRPAKKTKLTVANTRSSGRRSRTVSKTDTEGSTSSSEEDIDSEDTESEGEEAAKKPLSRSEAARLGWARRKKMLAAKSAEESTSSSDEEVEDEEEESEEEEVAPKKPLSRSEAARLGWERRKKMLAEAEALAAKEQAKSAPLGRREAAKLGWERRKKLTKTEKQPIAAKSKKKPSRHKGYGAAARARAARQGWERRKMLLAGVDPSSVSQASNDDEPRKAYSAKEDTVNAGGSSSTDESQPSSNNMKKGPAWLKSKPREGAKRSRRLAEDSTESHEESVRKMNELVSFLKGSRGWMEFHPSSRHGSGTHTYGYIPSSVASFIRSGAISKSVVLEHGTVGVHYALDYEGYGGLKEMIDCFGVDYSPYPTDEIFELSREVLGNRNAMQQVSAWDLGEDLPWQEVELAEEKRVEEFRNKMDFKTREDETSGGSDDDLLFVADILASISSHGISVKDQKLNHDAASECSITSGNQCTDVRFVEEEDSVERKLVDEDVIFIQSQSAFSRWNFGIC